MHEIDPVNTITPPESAWEEPDLEEVPYDALTTEDHVLLARTRCLRLDSEIDAIKSEIVRLKSRIDARENRISDIKGQIETCLRGHFAGKLKAATATIWVQDRVNHSCQYASGSAPQQAYALDSLEPRFVRRAPNLVEIKAAIGAGETVPGFVVVESTSTSVQWR